MKGRPRTRDIGIEVGKMKPGKNNTLTDLSNVQIGHTSLSKGEGKLTPGEGPVRTGVTAILPHRKNLYLHKVRGAANIINGYGKSIGIPQLQELGEIETPIMLTNTLNVWQVADYLVSNMIEKTQKEEITSINPVVGECNDAYLNDIQGRHVREKHVRHALESAGNDNREGNIGAGMGMSAFGMKGGIGMASRNLPINEEEYTLGVLVLSNFGKLEYLRINGVPVGKYLQEEIEAKEEREEKGGSIMVILGTDAPLSYRQLNRTLNRVPHGLARTGSFSHHRSGDFVIGFISRPHSLLTNSIPEEDISSFFQATVESVEEAIINSLLQAETLTGRNGNKRRAIPLETLHNVLKSYQEG